MRRTVAALACLAALTGCTSSGSSSPPRSELEQAGLQLSDFPPSWRRFPAPAIDVLQRLADCTGADLSRAGDTKDVVGSGVYRNGDRRIWSVTTGYESQTDVSARTAALSLPHANSCVGRVLRPSVAAAVPGAQPVATHYTAQAGAINTAASVVGSATGVTTVEADGRREKVHVDVTFVAGALYASTIVFVGVGQPVPERIQNALVGDVALRAMGR